MRWLGVLLTLVLAGCQYEETSREVGHKGRARVNPYLAAERFLGVYDFPAEVGHGWPKLDDTLNLAVFPAEVLGAARHLDQLDEWVFDGGHLLVTLSHGEAHHSDWNAVPPSLSELPVAMVEWLAEWDVEVVEPAVGDDGPVPERRGYEGRVYNLAVGSKLRLLDEDGRETSLVELEYGNGLVTVLSDARPLRNRYLGEQDHAEFLHALVTASGRTGRVVFVRGVGLSFFAMLWERGAPAVVGLLVLTGLWLWRNLPRFGPMDRGVEAAESRAYEHHLEAIGDYHWRLDRGASLLQPLREGLVERVRRAGAHPDDDLFAWVGRRAGLPRERAERAMTVERARDPASFTRLMADLQQIHRSIP